MSIALIILPKWATLARATSVIFATGQVEQQATPHVATTLACDVPLLSSQT